MVFVHALVHRAPILLPEGLPAAVARLRRTANHVGKVTHVLLQLHSLRSARQILPILFVAAQVPGECNARVQRYRAVRIGEAAVPVGAVGVAARAIRFVPDAFRHLVD